MRIATGDTEKDLAPRWHGIGGGSLLKAEKDGEVMFLLCTRDPNYSFIEYWTLVNIYNGEHVAFPGIETARASAGTVRDLIEGLEKLERERGYKFYECASSVHVTVYEREDGD